MIVGGLSLFLFGLNLMRESLIKINSKRLKTLIEKATQSKIKAIFTGFIASSMIQSSSGVTAIVIALISANLMSFSQGIMIMIGANVGTTTTAFIFTLDIERYSLLIIFIGFFLTYFNNKKIKITGNTIIGFGILFFGIFLMNQAFTYFSNSNEFLYITMMISKNGFTGVVGGTIVSALIQSSSATINIVQNLYALKAIELKSAISIMLGANVGTTIASLIPAIGSSKDAKQTVYINILFNIIGAVFFLIILIPFSNLMLYMEKAFFISNPKITVAYSHFIFNIISTVIIYFFIDLIINYTNKNHLTTMYSYDKIAS